MKKILHIISSPRGAASDSIKLGHAIVGKLQAANPGSTVIERNLVTEQFPHLEEANVTAFFTPEESRTPENIEAVKTSDQAIKEVMEADIIVIGAPMYNFGIHSSLKAWIDHIVRGGITFKYGAEGFEGMILGKKVYLAVSSGGVYSDGPMQSFDHGAPYLKTTLGLLGMTDITIIRAEGLKVPGLLETAMERAIESVEV